jgi:formate dehydrogenase major subunit
MDRRQFFIATGRGLGGSLAGLAFLTGKAVRATAETAEPEPGKPLKIAYATDTTSICPFCAVGCGLLVSSRDGKIINIEGDPDHPINEGALCCKGQSVFQISNNGRRLSKVKYRGPGAADWEEKDWDWALDKIARNFIKSRNEAFVKQENGVTVNRTDGVACFGGAALDNEECYALVKLMRAFGLTRIEHQARI